MPIIYRSVLETEVVFGDGDILIPISTDSKSIGFIQADNKHEIGSMVEGPKDIFCPVVLSFTNQKSVDVLIKQLQQLEF